MEHKQDKLSRMYIEEYLRSKGLSWEKVHKMPEAQAKKIMAEASTYAALKLAEVETRARVVGDMHDAAGS